MTSLYDIGQGTEDIVFAFLAAKPNILRRKFDIIVNALKSPTMHIVDNSGEPGDVVVAQLLEKTGNIGYNAVTGKFVDMLKAGIIDPAKVARIALQNAASVAALMLTTNVVIADLKDDDEENATVGAII